MNKPSIDELLKISESLGVLDDSDHTENLEYLLRMVWLGRTDKMTNETWSALCKLHDYYLCGEPWYEQPAGGRVIMSGTSHHHLSGELIRRLMKDITPQEKPARKRGWLSGLFFEK